MGQVIRRGVIWKRDELKAKNLPQCKGGKSLNQRKNDSPQETRSSKSSNKCQFSIGVSRNLCVLRFTHECFVVSDVDSLRI